MCFLQNKCTPLGKFRIFKRRIGFFPPRFFRSFVAIVGFLQKSPFFSLISSTLKALFLSVGHICYNFLYVKLCYGFWGLIYN